MLRAMGDRIAETALNALADNPRAQTFSYVCRRCMRCCYHKGIQVNPYEVARLARRLGQTTTKFRVTWTWNGAGTVLNQTNTGACAFLDSSGCTVYADRPLVCRLYPLGQRSTPQGVESFVLLEGHPQSAGELTKAGTIGGFLESQDAEPFIQAAEEYYQWYCAAHDRLSNDLASNPSSETSWPGDTAASDLIDMDATIARHCAETGNAEPRDIEERKRLHLTLLYERLANHKRGGARDQAEKAEGQ